VNTKASDFKTAFAAMMRAEPSVADGHPTIDELIAYRAGELPATERERLQEHLAACKECFEELRELDAFAAVPTAEAAVSGSGVVDFEVAAFWRQLRPQLALEPGSEEEPSTPEPTVAATGSTPSTVTVRRIPATTPLWRRPAAIAASFLVTVVGLGALLLLQQHRLADQGQTIAELTRPRPNPEIFDLYPDGSERSGAASEIRSFEGPAGATLIITPREPGDYPDYRVEIVDADGEEVWSGSGFEKHPVDGTFSLWLPPGAFPPGEYRVRLSGVAGGSSELLEEYVVHLSR
jgi:hypothetical protein